MSRAVALVLVLGAVISLGACSADHVDEPEPTITTPGAFLAVESEGGRLAIWRVLGEFRSTYDSVYWMRIYEGLADDLAEARRMAQDPDLPVAQSVIMATPANLQGARVVWYRSIDDEERQAFQ